MQPTSADVSSFKASASVHACVCLSGIVLALGGTSEAIAQEIVPAIVPGARVRVTTPNLQARPVVGKLVSVRGDTILLIEDEATAPTAFPKPGVRSLEISRGMSRQTRAGAMTGMFLGGIVGVIIGSAEASRCSSQPGAWEEMCGAETWAGLALGMVAGGLVGGVIGSQARVERWQPVPLVSPSLQAMVAPGRTGLALAVAF